MKEALEHMATKNENLADELSDTKQLLELHKNLLSEALKN